ncbi:MAG TPA: alpha-amylase family glycosyl hydrolase, partial [Burkholderiaceae bacterium]|nr:alpha-amylase family glycosyl hydrolase [Burkholderiaceae bacterium]
MTITISQDHQTSAEDITDFWRTAVVYQIYPRSFADSNGDGIGDLPGITSRVPYLRSLGVDAVWLSPFYPSALADGGYDVDDHRDVDPRLGTLADFDAMVSALHAADIKVIVDIV